MAICRSQKKHNSWGSNFKPEYISDKTPTTWGDFVRTRIRPNLNLKIWFGPDIRRHPKFWQFCLDYIRQGPFFRPKFVQMAIRPPDLYSGVLRICDELIATVVCRTKKEVWWKRGCATSWLCCPWSSIVCSWVRLQAQKHDSYPNRINGKPSRQTRHLLFPTYFRQPRWKPLVVEFLWSTGI